MSDSAGTVVAHEAYAFACMRCGHGWEQSFDIEHHTDAKGKRFVVYTSDGLTVPSPLTSPICPVCEGHVVRIMRSGQVAAVRKLTSGPLGSAALRNRSIPERAGDARAEELPRPGVLPPYDAAAEAPDHLTEPWRLRLPAFLRHFRPHEEKEEGVRRRHGDGT